MRIVLIGQAAFGAKTLEALLEQKETVSAVYTLPDKPGARPDPTKEAALAQNIPVVQPVSYRDDQVFEQYKAFKPDLTVMAFVTPIIPPKFFELPRYGTINYHPSLLPRHRGASAINWAVIMGEPRTGLSIFWPDGGIDTGPVLLQKEIPIGPDDTTGSLYFNHLFPMGVEAITESVNLIKEGRAPKLDQDEAAATYEPPCDDRVAAIDWQKSALEIYNLVRGCDPQPGAYAFWRGEKVRFYGANLIKESTGSDPGSIVAIHEEGIEIAVPDGRLKVSKVRSGSTGKIAGFEFATLKNAKTGDRFTQDS